MVEIEGDIVKPSELIAPSHLSGGAFVHEAFPDVTGAIFISGAALCWYDGSQIVGLVANMSGAWTA